MTPRAASSWQSILAGIILTIIGLLFIWQIALINLAYDAIEKQAGVAAEQLRPDNARAAALASVEHMQADRLDLAMTSARRAILNGPMNVVAIRTLGQARNRTESGSGNPLMLLAGQLGWRDVPTQVWLLQQAATVGEMDVAAQRAEAVIRVQDDPSNAFPIFRLLAHDATARQVVLRALAERPDWRGNFFELPLDTPADHLLAMPTLLAELARTDAPPSPREIRPTVNALFAAGRHADAWSLYAGLMGRGGNGLFNGGFDAPGVDYDPGGAASIFDWRLYSVGGTTAQVDAPTEEAGNRILYAISDGRSNHRIAERALLLRPGRYAVTFRMRSADPEAAQTLRFGLRCPNLTGYLHDEQAPIPPLPANQWSPRQVTFTVPANCPAQLLFLYPVPQSGARDREAWFDDVAIAPAG